MKGQDIRCDNDQKLVRSLLEEPLIKAVKDNIERVEEKGPVGVRRHLLSTSVRLSRAMSPGLHDISDHCIHALGIEVPLELYVYSSPHFNAACFKPEEGRLFVMFSSSLLEAFSHDELMFVMGHEFGHHIYQHHDIPIGYVLRGKQRPPASLALRLFSWSRYAEISADRAGALCCGNIDAVSRALFKLASGMRQITSEAGVGGNLVSFNLPEFLSQVDDMQAVDSEPGQGAPTQDWFSTHPFSPLRVKALQYFFKSEFMADGGTARSELELDVQKLMGVMEPDYLLGKTEVAKLMRSLFIAAAVSIANTGDGITEREAEVLKEFMGDDFELDALNIEKLEAALPRRLEMVRDKASKTQSMQVLRDLTVIAATEGTPTDEELLLLYRVADGLGISRSCVTQFIDADVDLD